MSHRRRADLVSAGVAVTAHDHQHSHGAEGANSHRLSLTLALVLVYMGARGSDHDALLTPVGQPRADMQLVPVWIHNHHAAQPGEAIVRGLLHWNAASREFLEPCVDVIHVQVNQSAHRAIAGVFS